jgi:diguanylate cyclase (GGDEF)-like protein
MLCSTPKTLTEQHYLKDDLTQTKNVILICMFFVSLLTYGDYLNFSFSSAFYKALLARTAFLFFSMAILLVLKHVKTTRHHDYVIILWCIMLIFLALFVNITRPVTNINFSYIDPLIVLALFLVFPCSIYIKGLLGSFLTIADLGVITLYKEPICYISLQTIGLSYLLAEILGLFMALRLQQFRQKQYSVFSQERNTRQELEKVAYVDYLTGALNRRKFFQLASLEFDKSKVYKAPFSIIMLDLDFFKNINDEFGHTAGDKYLQEFTELIVANKRSSDIFGRLGGEEFALILPGTNIQCALEMAERLRKLCAEQEIYFNNKLLHTTVSIGLSRTLNNDRTFQDVLTRADEALYQAKKKGRNRIQLKIEDIE